MAGARAPAVLFEGLGLAARAQVGQLEGPRDRLLVSGLFVFTPDRSLLPYFQRAGTGFKTQGRRGFPSFQ